MQVESKATIFPRGVTWAAVPGDGMSLLDAPAVQVIAAQLAPALAVYEWRHVAETSQMSRADVLVLVAWEVTGPFSVYEQNMASLGVGYGTSLSRRFGMFGGWRGPFDRSPEFIEHRLYTRRLMLEAVRIAGLPVVLQYALWAAGGGTPAQLSEGNAQTHAPFAPLLANAVDGLRRSIPQTALLWTVTVENVGKDPKMTPQIGLFGAAAAALVGQNAHTDVRVDVDGTVNTP